MKIGFCSGILYPANAFFTILLIARHEGLIVWLICSKMEPFAANWAKRKYRIMERRVQVITYKGML